MLTKGTKKGMWLLLYNPQKKRITNAQQCIKIIADIVVK